MEASLIECLKSIGEIRHHIVSLDLEAELFSVHAPEENTEKLGRLIGHLGTNIRIKRLFDYRSLIISVSGALEQFLDGILGEIVLAYNKIAVDYNSIPEMILKNHLDTTLAMLDKVRHKSYRGTHTVNSIISDLNGCLNSLATSITAEMYSNRRANYRIDVIVSMFSRIGITNILSDVKESAIFKEKYSQIFPDRTLQGLEDSVVFNLVDDLADRRNDVAHGHVGETLSHDLITPYVDLIEAIALGVQEVAKGSLLPVYARNHGKMIAKPIAVYDNRIVCLPIGKITVTRGDFLIGWDDELKRYIGGEILKVEVDKVSVPSVSGFDAIINAGFEVNFYAKENYTYCSVDKANIV